MPVDPPNERIKKILKKSEEWVPTTEVRNKADVHYYKTKEVLRKLLEEGKVEKREEGNYATYWKWKK